ncbi:LysR family transcriptional regulator [Cognatishimia sp. WU-CL00825]|uniref:LysR family transcriptional regulator n=1 Tax=Cognatishimia sp. WU-CL00825 TaxID=3127658 RepID=UPI003103DB54
MNLRRLDLNLLVVFDAIYAERNITQAGHKIGLSQPAVSNALSRFRHVIGDELFVRGPKALLPTRRARDIAGPIHAILTELSTVLDDAPFDPRTAQDVISIAMVDFFETLMLPRLMAFLDKNAPGIRLRLIPSFGRSIDYLDNGEVDIAIASFGHPPDRFGKQTLMVANYACVMRRSHSLATQTMSVKNFAQARHLLLSPKGDMRGFVDTELAKMGLARQVCLTVTGFLAASEVLLQTDTVMTAPEPVADKLALHPDLIKLPCPIVAPKDHMRLDAIWHKRHFGHAMGQWFLQTLAEIAQQITGPETPAKPA